MKDKTLWIMVGPPGIGKSWFVKNHLIRGLGWRYVSRDKVRFSIVSEDEDYFTKEEIVFKRFIAALKSAMDEDGVFNIVADATHINWGSRSKLLKALGQLETQTIDIIPVVITADVVDAINRNESREAREVVPRSVVRRMYGNTTDPKTDNFKYTAIMYVDNSINHYTEKKQVMRHKSDIKMKEIPIKDVIDKGV